MALPPLDPFNTNRLFVDYEIAPGQARSFQVRYGAPAALSDAKDWAEALLQTAQPRLASSFVVTGARYALAGSNVTLPTPFAPTLTPAGGTLVAALHPLFLAFQGRGLTTGRKAHLALYGLVYNTDPSYRFARGEDATVDDLLDFVQAAVAGVNIGIAAEPVGWYSYMNTGFNSYYQRKART